MDEPANYIGAKLRNPNATKLLIKVLMICDYLPPIQGGIENHVYNLVKQLGKCCKVYLLASRIPKTIPAYEKSGNIEIYRLQTKRYSFFRRLTAGLRLAKKNKVHLIHAHTLGEPCVIAAIIGKILHRPVIVTVHESHFIINMRSKHFRLRTFLSYYLRMKSAKTIITASDELRRYVVYVVGHRKDVKEIPNGVDLNAFRPDVNGSGVREKYRLENVKVVFCPRRITPKNGIIYLVEAVSEIVRNRKDVRFVFTGPVRDYDYMRIIQKRIRDLGIEPFVIFTGGVPYFEMPKLYAASDIVVIPSLIEAVSLSALEAMACKKSIVATAVGGLCEIIKNQYNGVLVKPADSCALERAILLILNDKELAFKYAENAYLTAKNFSWSNVAERTLHVYYHVLLRGG
jgi:glycosyltransferase involved in cell wall biosynthesis